MRKYINKKIVIAIITLLVFSLKSSTAQVSIQLNIDNEISSYLPELINIQSTNYSLKLDSIYEDFNMGYKTVKRKWLFNYENNSLISKKHFYYANDYSKQMDSYEEWFYNEKGQVVKYQERDSISQNIDSLFVMVLEENTYADDLLSIKKNTWISGYSISGHMVNGESKTVYEIRYSESQTNYSYNDEGNLFLVSKEPGKDSVFYYYYDSEHLRMKIEKNTSSNQLYVEKYEYSESNTMKHISKKYEYIFNTTDVSNIDNINLQSEYVYDYVLNENGKPDKITVTTNNYGFSNYDSQTFFEYNQNGQPVFISIYFRDYETDKWYEQGRLKYTYNDDGNISCYQIYFYDARLHDWVISEQKIYFYSSLKSIVSNYQISEMEVNIYPNPVKETIYMSGTSFSNLKYIIHDYSGKCVSQGEIKGNSINVNNLSKGLYLIKIYNNESQSINRFIKE